MLSQRVNHLEYTIREMAARVRQVERSGKQVIKLHIGDPLKYDYSVPEPFQKGLADNTDKGFYGPSEGVRELRDAIEVWERKKGVQVSADRIYAVQGLSEAIMFLMGALVDPGSKVLLPRPVYPLYFNFVHFFGGKPVFYDAMKEDLEEINEKIKGARAVVVINPNNPTGIVHSDEFVRGVVELAEDAGIPAIFDEIYDLLCFDKKPLNAGKLDSDSVVVLNGFSKIFLAPGYRLGYMYFTGENELEEAMIKFLRTRLSASVPIQYAAAAAINEGGSWIPALVNKLRRRRDVAYRELSRLFDVRKPEGAFYIFPHIEGDDWKFAFQLLEKKQVSVVPGTGFASPEHFRMVFLPPEEVIKEAVSRMEEFTSSGGL